MNYLAGVGYVNRMDLLQRSLISIGYYLPNTWVIDNSPCQELREQLQMPQIRVFAPSVPLSFSQTLNLLYDMAQENGSEIVIFMHNDAEAGGGTSERFLEQLSSFDGTNWGAAFTNYHALAAFRMEAVRKVGKWDTNLPRYFADNDYYRRMRLAGFSIEETNLDVAHHEGGSCTIRSDPYLNHINGVTFPLYQRYYEAKWGGEPGSEKFDIPFNIS